MRDQPRRGQHGEKRTRETFSNRNGELVLNAEGAEGQGERRGSSMQGRSSGGNGLIADQKRLACKRHACLRKKNMWRAAGEGGAKRAHRLSGLRSPGENPSSIRSWSKGEPLTMGGQLQGNAHFGG